MLLFVFVTGTDDDWGRDADGCWPDWRFNAAQRAIYVVSRPRFFGPFRVGGAKVGPIYGPIVGGGVGSILESLVAGNTPTPQTIGLGMLGGFVGDLGTGFSTPKHASGIAGGIGAILGAATS